MASTIDSKAPRKPAKPRSTRKALPTYPPAFNVLAKPPKVPIALHVIRIRCHKYLHRIGLMTDGTIWQIDCPGSASEVLSLLKYSAPGRTACNDFDRSLRFYFPRNDPSHYWFRGSWSHKNYYKWKAWMAYLAHHDTDHVVARHRTATAWRMKPHELEHLYHARPEGK